MLFYQRYVSCVIALSGPTLFSECLFHIVSLTLVRSVNALAVKVRNSSSMLTTTSNLVIGAVFIAPIILLRIIPLSLPSVVLAVVSSFLSHHTRAGNLFLNMNSQMCSNKGFETPFFPNCSSGSLGCFCNRCAFTR